MSMHYQCVLRVSRWAAVVAGLCFTAANGFAQRAGRGAAPPRGGPGPYGALSWRFIGPPGNRTIAVAGIAHEGKRTVPYVGGIDQTER